jgi:hypothetical protein
MDSKKIENDLTLKQLRVVFLIDGAPLVGRRMATAIRKPFREKAGR